MQGLDWDHSPLDSKHYPREVPLGLEEFDREIQAMNNLNRCPSDALPEQMENIEPETDYAHVSEVKPGHDI